MKLAIAFGKILVLAAMTWGLLSYLTPTMVPAPPVGKMVFLGLLAVHVAEAAVFARGLATEQGGTVAHHAGQLMLFGYLHVLQLRYG